MKNLRHLASILRESTERYVEFEFAGKYAEDLVFEREAVEAASAEIRAENGVPQACSEDIQPGLAKSKP